MILECRCQVWEYQEEGYHQKVHDHSKQLSKLPQPRHLQLHYYNN